MTLKNIIIKALIVLAPLVLVVGVFEWLGHKIPTSYGIKNSNLMSKKNEVAVIVLGSSHANFGINPQYMGNNVYNMSNTSQDFYYDYKILQKCLDQCPNLKLVILPISYFSMYFLLDESPEKWRTDFYSAILKIKKQKSGILDFGQYSYISLMNGPYNILNEIKKTSKLNINEFGYQYSDQVNDINSVINNEKGRARVEFHHGLMKNKNIMENFKNISSIVTLARNRKLQLVFITTPVYKSYYDNITSDYYVEMSKNINFLQNKYKIKYFNYFTDKRFKITDFMDNDHLNVEGAKKFSTILMDDINRGSVD